MFGAAELIDDAHAAETKSLFMSHSNRVNKTFYAFSFALLLQGWGNIAHILNLAFEYN